MLFLSRVLQLANRLDRSDANLIREIGRYLEGKEEFAVAANLYTQIGDIRSIALMHARAEHWEDVELKLTTKYNSTFRHLPLLNG